MPPSTSNISIPGLLRSTKTKGFTTQGAIHELVDNSIDAGATVVVIKFNSTSNTITISDNGSGMDEAHADKAYCIHNDKPASNKIGLFGVGKTVAEGILSDLRVATMTLTKVEGGRLLEISADWPKGISTGTWNPVSHGASADVGLPTWTRELVSDAHGTVVTIPMTHGMFQSLTAGITKFVSELCYVYQDIVNDVDIKVFVDGDQVPMDYGDALGWDRVTPEQRNSTRLEVWTKDNCETRVFHSEGATLVRFDRSKPNPLAAARIADYAASAVGGYTCSATFQLRSVYNPVWNPDQPDDAEEQRPEFKYGYLSFRRGLRHLKRFDAEVPVSGDFERRRVLGSARHSLDYTYDADSFLKTEADKSNVTKDNVDKDLLWTVRSLARRWSAVYYDRHRPGAQPPNPTPPVPGVGVGPSHQVLAQFKANFANEAWRASYFEFLAAHPVV